MVIKQELICKKLEKNGREGRKVNLTELMADKLHRANVKCILYNNRELMLSSELQGLGFKHVYILKKKKPPAFFNNLVRLSP